jgi:hypothetical protein
METIASNPFRTEYTPKEKTSALPAEESRPKIEDFTPPAKAKSKASPKNNEDTPALSEALKILAAHGLEATKKRAVYVKKTFEIEEHLADQFQRMRKALGSQSKEAIEEALSDWCAKNKNRYDISQKAKSLDK